MLKYCIECTLILGFVCIAIQAQAQVWEYWPNSYSYSPGVSHDKAEEIILLIDGSICVTGNGNISQQSQTTTIRYSVDGEQMWMQEFNPYGIASYVSDMVSDREGNVLITGTLYNVPYNVYCVKYDIDGNEEWFIEYSSTYGAEPGAVVCDNEGNIYLACSSLGDVVVLKYSSGGELLWEYIYDSSGGDATVSMELDSNDDVVVVGTCHAPHSDFLTLKLDNNGNFLWEARYAGPPDFESIVSSLWIDLQDNIFIGGYFLQNDLDIVIVKYGSEGEQLWDYIFDDDSDRLVSLEGDQSGNLFALGNSEYSSYEIDWKILKISPSGTNLWTQTYSSPSQSIDRPNAFCVDSSGDIYITGSQDDIAGLTTGLNIRTEKRDGSTGELVWSVSYAGLGVNYSDEGNDIVCDGDGNVYITGYAEISGYTPDYCTIRYNENTPWLDLQLEYVAGSPVPATGGDLVYDLHLEDLGSSSIRFDGWFAIAYESSAANTVVLRSFINYQSGWTINRPSMYYPIPSTYAAGNYMFYGRVGIEPNIVWAESGFPFTKEGTNFFDGFVPFAVDGAPNPFDRIDENLIVEAPSNYSLEGAFPNPFNPTTAISYQLSALSHVNLSVYDVAGRKVAELVNGYRDAGLHEVTFDATGLASGVYLYKLTHASSSSGQKHATQIGKMMLLK
ncbi:T9SS type A sorting domain-containing protein [bacterium]|nr:T9SS type A sorting domain-containing protein [bacterium]